MSASGVSQTYVAANANDGNQSTYWESTNSAFPQWLQVDLGSSVSVSKVILKTAGLRLGRPHRDAGCAGQHDRKQLH